MNLVDLSDVELDNCTPFREAVADSDHGESTDTASAVADMFITMALVTETRVRLKARGLKARFLPSLPKISNERTSGASSHSAKEGIKPSPVYYLEV